MSAFSQALHALREYFSAQGAAAPVEGLSLDDGSVTFTVKDVKGTGKPHSISIVLESAESYPNCSALVWCENSKYQDQLSRLSEQFQDRAQLHNVVQKVLNVLGYESIDLSAAAPTARLKANTNYGSGSEGYDSDAADSYDNNDSESQSDMDEDVEESEGGDDVAVGEDDEEERQLIIECGQRMGRWERFEAAQELAEAEASKQGLSAMQGVAAKRQIFNPKEAFRQLSKELLDIFRLQSYDLFVDSVGDDVYHWNVELACFDPASNLAKDMLEVQRRYAYSSVQFHIKFMRGLHPFYPPSVTVVRPHFKAPMLAAVTSHPMLQLDNWDPWRGQMDMIKQIKLFLEAQARVDLDSSFSDIRLHPYSCYAPVQRHLARLEVLAGVMPLCRDTYANIYSARDDYERDAARLQALHDGKKRTREETTAKGTVWAKGTGYGTGSEGKATELWDSKASDAAQRARDEEIRTVTEQLAAAVAKELGPRSDAPSPATPGSTAASTAPPTAGPMAMEGVEGPGTPGGSSTPPEDVAGSSARDAEALCGPSLGPEGCIAVLQGSCLIPFLIKELVNASFGDMASRAPYYITLLAMISELCRPATEGLFHEHAEQSGPTLAHIVRDMLRPAAARYLAILKPDQKQSGEPESVPSTSANPTKGQQAAEQAAREAAASSLLARRIIEVANYLVSSSVARAGAAGHASTLAVTGSSDQSYCAALKLLQVDAVSGLSTKHHFKTSAEGESAAPRPRDVRLAKEVSSLDNMLPLNETSSIFVRVDEQRHTMWKALIVGPEDTPYSGGCFIFDIYFPPQYPACPPNVNLQTTGGGTVRFNPNLYNCGKVCLSLLGTWGGGKGEGWNADASTALQVLVSIQSLILVPDPYFNEPSYETSFNTDQGRLESRNYNKVIREATIKYAMVDQLKHPAPEFADVIRQHFKLRKAMVLETVGKWIEDARGWSSGHADELTRLRAQLMPLLNAL